MSCYGARDWPGAGTAVRGKQKQLRVLSRRRGASCGLLMRQGVGHRARAKCILGGGFSIGGKRGIMGPLRYCQKKPCPPGGEFRRGIPEGNSNAPMMPPFAYLEELFQISQILNSPRKYVSSKRLVRFGFRTSYASQQKPPFMVSFRELQSNEKRTGVEARACSFWGGRHTPQKKLVPQGTRRAGAKELESQSAGRKGESERARENYNCERKAGGQEGRRTEAQESA